MATIEISTAPNASTTAVGWISENMHNSAFPGSDPGPRIKFLMELLRLLEDEMGRMTNKTGLLRCEHGIPDGVLNTAAKNCGLAMPLAINVRHFSIEVSAQIVTVWVFDDHTGELLQKKMIWSS